MSIANLAVSVASSDAFSVRQFTVQEALSSPFLVSLVVVSENAGVDFDAVVGQPARFSIQGERHARSWSGLCNRFEQIGFEQEGMSIYHLNVVPRIWLATQRRNYRMFQQASEPEIVLQLLDEWGIVPDEKLTGIYKKRKYRVQYGESDFAFMSRMLEDAGITYYFEPRGEETRLVLSDAPQTNEPRAQKIQYRDGHMAASWDYVTAVRIGREVRPGRYTMRDHDYRQPPDYKLLADAVGGDVIEQQLEQVHYAPGAFLFGTDKGESTPHADDRGKTRTDEREAKSLAQRRLDAKRGNARTCTFETNALDLAPGMVMSMLDHPRAELGESEGLLVIGSTLSGTSQSFTHACEVRSASLAYRPRLHTPKPKVSGVESATVVGPKGEEIHTDEFGRVRVHFHWDRESSMNEKSSCWIHVSQGWGGAGFGTTQLPRVGQEVLVDFISGDPDRPIVVGRVYTNTMKTPYKLPDHKTQSGWKSSSTGKSGGYNEIMFEDLGGQELVRIQAERDLTKLVKRNESVSIGGNRSTSVGHDDSLSVGNDRSRMVGNNESVTVGSNQSITVGADQTLTVGGKQTETITDDRTLVLTGNLTETIIGNATLTQVGDQSVTLSGNQSETVSGDISLVQLGSQTEVQAGSRTLLHLGSETELRLGNELHAQLGNETQIRVGTSTHFHVGSQTETVTTVKTIDTPVLNIDASTMAVVKAALIELISTGMVTLEGTTVSIGAGAANVIASGETTIKGSIIKLNC
ncbi:type VI secretion system Vgr family protein [Chondromyces apiculatus]|uniref:VgrG protein n=1 Tax=Chondromyces apiculatus DSM 436 TaxID=1192034 RepID=A0A017THE1_9BACT|nr:type VI secretion system tip protein TssI/VgrG [Chondromyces apiculatus]EYF08688.1 VgrG protein [Chondromyces apiculatus DSM 436]